MSKMASEQPTEYSPTYREREVDATLDEHDRRISRLEKAALVGAGYALARLPDIASQLAQLIL